MSEPTDTPPASGAPSKAVAESRAASGSEAATPVPAHAAAQPFASNPAELAVRRELSHTAQAHYQRGNRFYDTQAWERALEEWRSASRLWQLATATGRLVRQRWAHVRAVLALLCTVLLVYAALFTLLPRDPVEMMLIGSGGGQQEGSWWQRFLDTGRPELGSGHKMGVREWWERFRRRMGQGEGEQVAGNGRPGRQGIDARWEELLRRYGRWGPFFNFELDYHVISGYGLSRMGDYARAVEVFQQGIEHTTRPEKLADLYQGLANAHYNEGYRLQPDGLAKYDLLYVRKAIGAYESSVAKQPRPVSYGNLGWMYFLLGEYRRSEQNSQRALTMDASLEYVRLNLGLTYLLQDKAYQAFDVYRDVIRRDPADDVYLGGINDLREVIRDHPGRVPFAHLMVGILALKQGDLSLAQESLTRFQAMPFVAQSWRELAQRLLSDMSTQRVER